MRKIIPFVKNFGEYEAIPQLVKVIYYTISGVCIFFRYLLVCSSFASLHLIYPINSPNRKVHTF